MKRLMPVPVDAPLLEELPAEANTQSGHSSVFPQMIELRLATGQGTSETEVVLIADLWIGEGTIYDPKTRTEVAIWFKQGFLHLDLGSYSIRSGSRFGDRRAPETALINATTTVKQKDTASGGVGGSLRTSTTGHLSGSLGLEGRIGREASRQATVTTKRELSGTPHVAASGNLWEVKPVGRDPVEPSSIEDGASRFKYIDTSDRLCDLSTNASTNRSPVRASFCVYPSALRYRVNRPGRESILKRMMSVNQSRVVDLLLQRGAENISDRGLGLAQAWVSRTLPDTGR